MHSVVILIEIPKVALLDLNLKVWSGSMNNKVCCLITFLHDVPTGHFHSIQWHVLLCHGNYWVSFATGMWLALRWNLHRRNHNWTFYLWLHRLGHTTLLKLRLRYLLPTRCHDFFILNLHADTTFALMYNLVSQFIPRAHQVIAVLCRLLVMVTLVLLHLKVGPRVS